MALPSSGPISLDMIAAEFGGSPPHSLSEYYRGGPYVTANNTGIPTSGQISLDQFHGAVKVVPGSVTFSSPGTYTFTVPVYSSLTVYSDGAGGGGAAFGGYNGNAGGNSSFNGTVIGNGGGGGLYGATGPVSGGAAGSASGGDTNLSGSPGVAVGAGLRDATAGGASAAGGVSPL